MHKIGFISNPGKDTEYKVTKRLGDFLSYLGKTVIVGNELSGIVPGNSVIHKDNIFEHSDMVAVLGGDGTVLGASYKSAEYKVPLMGINLGNLGYLTTVDSLDAEKAFIDVFDGNYQLEERMMLHAVSYESKISEHALNDICFLKSDASRLTQLDLYINNEFIDSFRGDGLIVSSPTGSTAYNLSAGGPLLKPDARMLLVTPINTHKLYSRPLVVSEDDVISVCCTDKNNPLIVAADGRKILEADERDTVTIQKAKVSASIIKTGNLGFYDIVRKKLIR